MRKGTYKVIFNSVITYVFCRTSFHLLCRICRTQQMSRFSVFHFILIAQARVLFTMQYSHCTEYGNNDFHEEIHHSQLRIYFWNATFRQGRGIPFSFGMDSWGRQKSDTYFTGWWCFQNLITHLLLFLTAGTTLVVINSAQILQIKLLKLDPHKMKNKQKPQSFCLV